MASPTGPWIFKVWVVSICHGPCGPDYCKDLLHFIPQSPTELNSLPSTFSKSRQILLRSRLLVGLQILLRSRLLVGLLRTIFETWAFCWVYKLSLGAQQLSFNISNSRKNFCAGLLTILLALRLIALLRTIFKTMLFCVFKLSVGTRCAYQFEIAQLSNFPLTFQIRGRTFARDCWPSS